MWPRFYETGHFKYSYAEERPHLFVLDITLDYSYFFLEHTLELILSGILLMPILLKKPVNSWAAVALAWKQKYTENVLC